MPNHYFVSYSGSDAEKFALTLADDLQAGPPSFPVWLFRRELHAAAGDWDTQIREAIRECDSLIFVMSRDSVTDESVCKPEWTAALKFKKPILLIRLHADADAPFRIASRQYIDFVGDYKTALAKLRKDLQWLHSPEGELQTLKYRLRDAERDFERAPDADRPRIQADIDLLRKQIAEQTEAVKNPAAAARRTEASIAAALERARRPPPLSGTGEGRGGGTKFINPPPATAPRYFQDRYEENKIVANFLRDEACRMLTINGRAGIGKTAMVCRLLKSLESGHLPDDLGEMSVDGIVYLSAIGTRTINTPNLFADLCHLLPTEISNQLDALYRDPKVSTTDKLLALLEKFSSGRVVVLLDNFESVVDDECCVKDAELDEALRALLRAPHHAVKIILTTRIAPHDLNLIEAGRQTMLHLDEGLESPFAENVLRECDADGKVGLKNAPADLLKCARERTRGFPRALEALYAILSADRYTALEEILGVQHPERSGVRPSTPLRSAQEAHAAQSKEVPLPENVVAALVGEAFSRLDPTAQKVMQGLAAYARPVPPAAVDYLLQPYLPSIDSALVLNRLVNMQFAHREAGKYYLHPADREYAWSRVLPLSPSPTRQDGESGSAGEGETSFTQRALLTRAADYFRDARKPRETWKTLADLEPQLNEFDLRCAAEDYDTAAYVLLEIDGNYLSLWGHYRLLVEMHERLQGKIADSDLKRRSRGNLGMTYEHTGQIPKAIASYEQALAMAREMKNRQAEGVWLGNLGDAYAALGQTARAIEFHKQALAIDREIGDKQGEGITLHWMGADSADMGQVFKAIEFYRQSLAIAREIKHQSNEAWAQGNLGTCFAMLAQYEYAIEMCQEALRIRHEIGDRRGEGYGTGELAEIVIDQGHYIEAIQLALESARIGEETSHPGISNRANRFLALAHFYSGNLPAARAAAEAARKYDEPTNSHNVLALLGIIALRQNDRAAAQEAFTAAIAHADVMLKRSAQNYDALDAKGVALCGLGLGEDNGQDRIERTNQAAEVFRAARAINRDAGIVARVVRLLDALALAVPDDAETLAEARKVASGE